MNRNKTRRTLTLLLAALMLLLTACGQAGDEPAAGSSSGGADSAGNSTGSGSPESDWPASNMTFNLTVGYNPGGTSDSIARAAAPYFEDYLGISVVVQNIPGSGGLVGTNSVYAGKSDGYTVIYTATTDGIWSYKGLSPDDTPWELSEWKSTGVFASLGAMGFISAKDAGWEDFADLIEDARSRPERDITIATIGPGRLEDVWMIEIQEKFGVQFNWVFYDGSGSIQTDILTGDVDVGLVSVIRSDFLDHPEYKVLCGIVDQYPEDSPYHGVFKTMRDFEDRLGYTMDELPAMKVQNVTTFVVKSDIPDDAYAVLCESVREMCAQEEFQEQMKLYTWPTYISPEDAESIFEDIYNAFVQYQDVYSQYVVR